MLSKSRIALAGSIALFVGLALMAPVASQTPSPTPTQSASGSPSPSPSPSPSDGDHITITREDPPDDDRSLPIVHAGNKPKGFSKGDIVTFMTPLLVPGSGAKDGNLTAQCTVITSKETKVKFFCNAEAIFDEGRLTGHGTIAFGANEPSSVIAITGGTGQYEHARGEVTISENPNLVTFDVHLES